MWPGPGAAGGTEGDLLFRGPRCVDMAAAEGPSLL